jgi:transposase InsO family protein
VRPHQNEGGRERLDGLIAHVELTDKSHNIYRRFLPIKIDTTTCAALVDSGNLWRNVISVDMLKRLGMNETDLRPIGRTRLATAKEGADLKILGELKRPIYLALGGTGTKIKDRPVVVEGLNMAFNLSGPFMKQHGIDQLHSQDSIVYQGRKVKLLVNPRDSAPGPEASEAQIYFCKQETIPPLSFKYVNLRASAIEERTMPGGDGFVCGSVDFMEKFDVHPFINALVTADPDGNLIAGVMNTLEEEVTVPEGTRYGSFTLAVKPEQQQLYPWRVATLGLDGPAITGQQSASTTEQLAHVNIAPVKQKAAVHPDSGDEEQNVNKAFQLMNAGEQGKWLTQQFGLTKSPCLKTADDLQKAIQLLRKFSDIFSYDGSFGKTSLVTHRIVTEDVQPIKTKNRPINPSLEQSLEAQLETWKRHGVIEPSESPWSFALVAVPKKNGGTRWCVDYRRLNLVTIKDAFPLPSIEDNLARLASAKIFSGIDGCGAYHVVEVEKKDRVKTAFSTPWGAWQFCRMPFGLTNAPATYCRLVQMVLQGIPQSMALAYVDDTVVHSPTLDKHFIALEKVFLAHRGAGLKLQPSKCQLFKEEIEYLGHMIDSNGIRPVPEYIKAVVNWPIPSTRTEARAFLGKVGYYRKFIQNYSGIAQHWTEVTGKGTKEEEKTPLTITEVMRTTFDQLKKALVTSPILAYPRFTSEEKFILDTDWSQDFNSIGGVLSQLQDGVERVIRYGAKKLSSSQKNYSPTKGELWAVIYFMREWRYYLRHRKFLLRTDHSCLRYIYTMEAPTGMVARWLETLSNHNFDVQYRPGKDHGNADALSRVDHAEEADSPDDNEELLASMATERPNWTNEFLKLRQIEDADLKQARLWVDAGKGPEREEKRLLSHTAKIYLGMLSQLRIDAAGVLCRIHDSLQVRCLPMSMWHDAILYVHMVGAHMGRDSTVRRLCRNFYFPGIKREVDAIVSSCVPCQTKSGAKPKEQRHTLYSTQDGYPFRRIAIDFVGPFPRSAQGSRYILTVKCCFSRWMEGFPMAESKATDVCWALEKEIFCRFGMPEQIHSDHGTQFTGIQLEEISKELGVRLTNSPTYNPKSNPVERSHRDIGPAIKSLCQDLGPEHWERSLPRVLFALNTNVCATTGVTPFRLMFGREASQPLDHLFGLPPRASRGNTTHHKYAEEQRRIIDYVSTWARKNIMSAVMRQARLFNGEQKSFTKGAKVWLYTPTPQKKWGKKLSTFWSGPWTIEECHGTLLYTILPHRSWQGRVKVQTVGIDRLLVYNPPILPGYPEKVLDPPRGADLEQLGNEFMEFIPGKEGRYPQEPDEMAVFRKENNLPDSSDDGDSEDGAPQGGGAAAPRPATPPSPAISTPWATSPTSTAEPTSEGSQDTARLGIRLETPSPTTPITPGRLNVNEPRDTPPPTHSWSEQIMDWDYGDLPEAGPSGMHTRSKTPATGSWRTTSRSDTKAKKRRDDSESNDDSPFESVEEEHDSAKDPEYHPDQERKKKKKKMKLKFTTPREKLRLSLTPEEKTERRHRQTAKDANKLRAQLKQHERLYEESSESD